MIKKSRAVQHLQIINVDDEYGTPKNIFFIACKMFKLKLEIDLAASGKNHVLKKYITKKQNTFNYKIKKPSYLNPPYSEIKKFMRYVYEQNILYNQDILVLVYAKTDTDWWHQYVEGIAEVHFIKGRIRFNNAKGKPSVTWDKKAKKFKKGVAPYPSVWVIYRRKKK